MTDPEDASSQNVPKHDPADTSQQISGVVTDPLPASALRENTEGRKLTTSPDGFGKLWRKHFWIRIDGAAVTPAELIGLWKNHYSDFWPKGSHLYQPPGGIKEGDVAPVDLSMLGGLRIGTGVVVTDIRDTSFTFSSLQGHTFCGTITFSGSEDRGATIAEVETILRASDPLYEIGMALGGHRYENRFWKASLVALARSFDLDSPPGMTMECLDSRRQWRHATNIVHNALLHTLVSVIADRVRHLGHTLQPRHIGRALHLRGSAR